VPISTANGATPSRQTIIPQIGQAATQAYH
jgi:hypothetical protein